VVDQRSDIFSFGCVLYEILTGARPFAGDTTADVMGAILREDPDVSSIPSPGLQRIVAHCLEKSPEERFQSARDIAFDLETITQSSGPKAAAGFGVRTAKRNLLWRVIALTATLACIAFAYIAFRPVQLQSFRRLTFRRGLIHAARFSADGNGVVYSANWEDEPSELFTARLDAPGSRALGLQGRELRSISSSGELALLEKAHIVHNTWAAAGLLARAPFPGGTPRAIENNIDYADWSPDGTELSVVRETGAGTQLEFPEGKVLYRTAGYISEPRISPDGARVAFVDHPLAIDNGGFVAVINRSGQKQVLTEEYSAAEGLAWSPTGNEVWFSAAKADRFDLYSVTLGGRQRVLLRTPASIVLQDVSKDGRVLITTMEQRMKLFLRGALDNRERELSWLDWSLVSSLFRDGKHVAFFESGQGAGAASLSYVRETNGAPPVLLGKGAFPMLSPDEQSVVAFDRESDLIIYPVGPGPAKRIAVPGFRIILAGLMQDGKQLWFNGNEVSRANRYYLMSVEGGKPRPITPRGVQPAYPGLVLDGRYLAGVAGGNLRLCPVDGGKPEILPGIREGEETAGWSQDQSSVFVYSRTEFPWKVYKLDRIAGKRDLLLEVAPINRAGATAIGLLRVTPDGKTYGYSVLQQLSELQLVQGLK
jgi:eukaryotic-like serine/threonine-protein kinase